jgi:hypothetical protein
LGDKDLELMREILVKRLGIKRYEKYPDRPWRELRQAYGDDDLLRVLRSEDDDEWKHLTGFAGAIYRAWADGRPRREARHDEQTGERTPSHIGDYERMRSRIFSEYLAKHASAEFMLRRFRATILDDQLLSPQQAWGLLTSPLAAHWPASVFDALGVPLIDHTYRVKEGMEDEKGSFSIVEVSTPDSDGNRSIRPLEDRRNLPQGRWEVPSSPDDARSHGKPRRELNKSWKILPFPGEDGRTHRVLVLSGAVLGELHEQAGRLIQHYPWEESDAVWFILTGEAPWVSPVTWQARWFGGESTIDSFRQEGETFSYGFITLKIEPWVSPESVQQVYREAQQNLIAEHRVRRLEDKSLKLLQFVTERMDPLALTPEERKLTLRQLKRRMGSSLVADWDKENSKDVYGVNTWKFWRDFNRVRRAVLSPTYEWRGEG